MLCNSRAGGATLKDEITKHGVCMHECANCIAILAVAARTTVAEFQSVNCIKLHHVLLTYMPVAEVTFTLGGNMPAAVSQRYQVQGLSHLLSYP